MWLHLFGLSFLSSFQLCQVINSKFDIFGVNVGILGFTALDLTTFSKSKPLFFLNLKQNLLFIFFFWLNKKNEKNLAAALGDLHRR